MAPRHLQRAAGAAGAARQAPSRLQPPLQAPPPAVLAPRPATNTQPRPQDVQQVQQASGQEEGQDHGRPAAGRRQQPPRQRSAAGAAAAAAAAANAASPPLPASQDEVGFDGLAAALQQQAVEAAAPPRWSYLELLDARRAAALVAGSWQRQEDRRQRQQLELLWPPLDSLQPRGRLKSRRVQRRWGVRQKLPQQPEEPGVVEVEDSQEEGQQQQQQRQPEEQQPEEQHDSERGREGPRRKRPRVAPATEQAAAADGAGEQQPAAGRPAVLAEAEPAPEPAAAAAEEGDVELPVVPGVPPGLMQQLALLPGGRPPCGRCSACAPAAAGGGTRGCRTLAALKRWDALLPGLPIAEVQRLPERNRRCGRCRTCLLMAHAGGSGRARSSAASCMALSRVRVGRLQAQLRKLREERQQWAAAQAAARQQQQAAGMASDGDAPGDANGPSGSSEPSSPSSSDSEGSNRSRTWMREQRRRKRAHLQPLPAPDGSLPLPFVLGVPWERVSELAAAWTGVQAAPQRCGVCSDCRAAEDEEQEGGDSSQHQRCAAAAALVTWDRQLGPVTAAAVRSIAALPAADQRAARCGSCRQCRPQPEGQQQPCNTAKKLAAGKLPPRLAEAAAAAAEQPAGAADDEPAASSESQPSSSEPSLSAARSSHDARSSGGGSAAPRSSQRTSTLSGQAHSRSRGTSSGYSSSSSGTEAEHFSSGGSGSEYGDSEEDARWLPWVRSYLPEAARGRQGGDSSEDDEGTAALASARALLQRQRDREARYGPRGLPRCERGVGGWDSCATERLRYRERTTARLHQVSLMDATARCLAAELRVPLGEVADWRCVAPTGEGGEACGHRHRHRAALTRGGWHLWQCFRCGAPRWDGPGWQLHQRLAAALQAGAALSHALLPPHGADAPASAAARAAAAALARLRWEAAGAGAAAGGPAAAPDADGSSGGSDDEAPGRPQDAAAGLPSLDGSVGQFQELADLAASLLAESRRALEGGCGASLDPDERRRCRDMRRSDLGQAAVGLERAAMRLVEEQQALLALRQQQQQYPPRQWQQPGAMAAVGGLRAAAFAPVAAASGRPSASGEQQPRQQGEQQPFPGYGQLMAEAQQLLHDCGLDGAAGGGDEEQQQQLLELCDALLFLPSAGSEMAALGRLRQLLQQQQQPQAPAAEPRQPAAPAGAAAPGGSAHAQQFPQPQPQPQQRGREAGDPMELDGPGSQQEAQQAQQQQESQQQQQQGGAFGLLLAQASPLAASQQQASPPLFMSQAGDNMAASPAAASPAPGAGGFLVGTQASQPDPLEALQPQQELQRELLERRQQQQERRRRQRQARRQAEAQQQQQEAQQQEAAPQAGGLQEAEAERLRAGQLHASTTATYHFVWRLLGELLQRVERQQRLAALTKQQQRKAQKRQRSLPVNLRLPPPPAPSALQQDGFEAAGGPAPLHSAARHPPGLAAAAAALPGLAAAAAAAPVPAPAAGWVAWQAGELGDRQQVAGRWRLAPQPPLPLQQASLLRSAPRFQALTACHPTHGPPLSALEALLPEGQRPGCHLQAAAPAPVGADAVAGAAQTAQPTQGDAPPAAAEPAQDSKQQQARADLAAQRQLVAAHPQLVLVLERPELQRCGACSTCVAMDGGGGSRRTNCLVKQYCDVQWRSQQRQVAAGKRPAAQKLRRSEGVSEAAALRVAAAYKLLHPAWDPPFLSPACLAEVAAALPAAVAALGPPGEPPHSLRWRHERNQRLARRVQGEEVESSEGEEGADGSSRASSQQPASCSEGDEPAPAQQQQQQQQQQRRRRQPEQDQEEHRPALGVAATSAFRRLPSAALPRAAAAAPQPPLALLPQELQQLAALPADVQMSFQAGLAVGLPPAAVAAALRRFQRLAGQPTHVAAAAAAERNRQSEESSSASDL